VLFFNKALAIDPKNKVAYAGLGDVYSLQRKYIEAIGVLRKALEIDPKFATAHAIMGTVLTKTGQVTEAKRHLTEAIRLDSENASPYVTLANMSCREQDFEEGKRLFRLALQRDPDSPAALIGLAEIFIAQPDAEDGGIEEAIRLAEKACGVCDRKDPLSLLILARAHVVAGQFEEALSAANEALSLATTREDPELQGFIQSEIDMYLSEQRRFRP
jgi:cytochrome c-type biogenesis protein CcmH/NrfG